MEHVAQGTTVDVVGFIGALELGIDPATIRLPNDTDLESTMSFGPDPTKAISCPTVMCNFTKPVGCRIG